MESNIDLSSVATVSGHSSYTWSLSLSEFNGQCRIHYSTNSPLLAGGTINLVTTGIGGIVAFTMAKPEGGYFDTEKPWGIGWYAMWSQLNEDDKWTVLVSTPVTS